MYPDRICVCIFQIVVIMSWVLFDRLVCDDISGGQENFPIPATNLVDNPPVPPPGMLLIHDFGSLAIFSLSIF